MSIFSSIQTCRAVFFVFLCFFFIISSASALASTEWSVDRRSAQVIRPETASGLRALYQTMDYNWKKLKNGVPPFILEVIPADINNTGSTAVKKRTFFMGLLPMILLANQEIKKERAEVLRILEKQRRREARRDDRDRLEEIAQRYGLRVRPYLDHRTRTLLLKRVDTIPPALVLAQAANESAWGTSRFSRLGNNLFGEWTYSPGTGIVPEDRPTGQSYEVRKFPSLYESIRSYMNNLNRNGAYRKLREIRSELRNAKQPVTGVALARGLEKYSQRGEEYIREIQAMIRQNKLSRVNAASLRKPRTELFTNVSTDGSGLFSTRNRAIGHIAPSRLNP